MVKENQIEYELKDGRYLNMNLYEIRLEENIIYNDALLEAFLFDCQCALFLVDMTNHKSFEPVKTIISFIKDESYPNLKKIIVENKSDITTEKQNVALKNFVNFYPNIGYTSISLKTGDNFEDLLIQIYNEINPEKNIFPLDKVAKCSLKADYVNENYKGAFSLILVGDTQVGKSNFMTRYAKNKFNADFISSIGMNNEIKMMKIKNEYYKLTLWDTAGQERFRSLPRKYYRNVDGVLLLFDINDKSTFEDVNNWMKEINEYSTKSEQEETKEKKVNDIVIYLLANKIDLINKESERVTKEEIDELVNRLGIKYYEISCKWNLNLEEVMARICLDCYQSNRNEIKNKNIQITKVNNSSKKRECCLGKKEKVKKK